MRAQNAYGYRYADDDAEYSFVFGKRGKPWRKNSLLSDAEFVYWKRKPGSTDEHLILGGGSFAQVEGGIELHCARPVQWAEVMVTGGSPNRFLFRHGGVWGTAC